MYYKLKSILSITLLSAAFIFVGCSSDSERLSSLENDMMQKEQELKNLQGELENKESTIEETMRKSRENEQAANEAQRKLEEIMNKSQTTTVTGDESLFPPNAKPGECYARVFIPPTYRTDTEKVSKNEASERIEIIPAKYDWVDEQILIKEASTIIKEIPAKFTWVEEEVLVKESSSRLETVPAKYEWKEERVLEKEAHTSWKKGRGLIEKVDNSTGEIMCLVEVPATYKTIRKKVMVSPPATRTVNIPAEYKTVKVKKVLEPAKTKTVTIPAEYKTVRVKKQVSPPKTRTVNIPADYQTVTKNIKVTDGHMEWKAVLCETNVTPGMISKLQNALNNAGHSPGPIDGVYGSETSAALKSYQRAKGLAIGQITHETLKKLGIWQ